MGPKQECTNDLVHTNGVPSVSTLWEYSGKGKVHKLKLAWCLNRSELTVYSAGDGLFAGNERRKIRNDADLRKFLEVVINANQAPAELRCTCTFFQRKLSYLGCQEKCPACIQKQN